MKTPDNRMRILFSKANGYKMPRETSASRSVYWQGVQLYWYFAEPDFVQISLSRIIPGDAPVFTRVFERKTQWAHETSDSRTYLPLNPLLGMNPLFEGRQVKIADAEKLHALLSSYTVPLEKDREFNVKVLPLEVDELVAAELLTQKVPFMRTDAGVMLL